MRWKQPHGVHIWFIGLAAHTFAHIFSAISAAIIRLYALRIGRHICVFILQMNVITFHAAHTHTDHIFHSSHKTVYKQFCSAFLSLGAGGEVSCATFGLKLNQHSLKWQ